MKVDWSTINTVLLDMDGTLLDLHYDSHFWLNHLPKVYGDIHGLTRDEVMQVMMPIFENNAGTLNWYCVDFWSESLGLDIMVHKTEVANNIAYRPTAKDFLNKARTSVSDMRLVTNAHRKGLMMKVEKTNIDQYFDEMICSHELGTPKEDVDFWYNLQQQNHFDPQQTLLIDDNESVLDAAHAFGIKNIFSIERPDSSKPRTTLSKFEMLDSLLI